MTGYFSAILDPLAQPSSFGPQTDRDDGSSGVDGTDQPRVRWPFFSLDPALFRGALNPPGQYFGSLAPPATRGMSARSAGGMVVPVAANFGPRGGAGEQDRKPYWADIPGFPSADPRMPFFALPPNAIFNMPIITQLPGTPYVGKDGLPHLDGWNPWQGRVISPGPGI